jgi:hypothetical protein
LKVSNHQLMLLHAFFCKRCRIIVSGRSSSINGNVILVVFGVDPNARSHVATSLLMCMQGAKHHATPSSSQKNLHPNWDLMGTPASLNLNLQSSVNAQTMPAGSSMVTGNTGAVTFWEAQHAAASTKCCTYHAMPPGRHGTQKVTVPPSFGPNPGNSKTNVCCLPSTHTMTNFSLSCFRLKK